MATAPPLLALALRAPTAKADTNSNRQILPLGETEQFLGNAGTGRATDSGAVYYNPSGLAEITAPDTGYPFTGKVSVSGAVYLKFDTSTSGLVNFDGQNVPFKASGFNTIPATYTATHKFGEWVTAVSVLVPSSQDELNHSLFTTENTHDDLVFHTSLSELWFGLSIAHTLGERFRFGLSLFAIQHSEQQILGFDVQFPDNPTTSVVTSIAQSSLSVIGASATLGLSYIASKFLRFGLRAQTPFVEISGSADTYQTTHVVANGQVDTTGENLRGTPANYRMPFDFTLGAAVTPVDWLALLGDVSLQLGSSYTSIPGSTFSDDVVLKPTPRVSLGVEVKPAPTVPVRAGMYYNPSANGGKVGDPGYQAEDYYGVTGGVGFNSGPVQTGLGGFYIWSSGELTPGNSTGGSASLASHGYGVLLTTSYLL